MTFLLFLFNNRVTRAIGAALAALAGILAYGAMKKRQGATEAKEKADEADKKRADVIADRVEHIKRVRPNDLKFRD